MERKSYIVGKQFMKFFVPTVFMTMALSMSVVVDGMIVGNFLSPDALAAVNLVLPVTLIFNSLYALFGVGGSALYSVAIGRREKQRSRQLFTMAAAAMVISAVIVVAAGLSLCRAISDALTHNAPNLTELVYDYIKIVIPEAPLFIVIPGLVYFIRSSGKVKIASAALITANVINLALDLLYILVFDLGISGAALATGSGYFVGLIIAIVGVVKCKDLRPCRIPAKQIGAMLKEIVSTGLPSMINTVLNFFRLTCINMIVMSYLGSDGVTAFSVCTSCLSIVSMFVSGSAQTMVPLLGTLYGEGDVRGVRFTIKKALTITGASTLILLAMFELFPAQITGLFGVTDATQIAIAVEAIRIYAISLPIMGILFVSMCVYPIVGFRRLSSFIALLEGFFIVVPAAFVLSRIFGSVGIWTAFPVGEIGSLLILALSTAIMRKKNPDLRGLFLLKQDSQKQTVDITMIQDVSQSVEVSERAIEFCKQNHLSDAAANRAGVALEDMVVNIINHNKRPDHKSYIDIRITLGEDKINISVRDNGAPYNPLLGRDNEERFDNIGVVLAMADEVLYDNILGMNSSIIKIDRTNV